ncbi:hypothetical protein [Nonomuraea soli]|uniref:Uncharacterized protein n=1 Tax=Nonomuraea soli TaxID=1032476 RepID=A0A7W0HNN5_9ACTN|nr:hypothetical protein [Nonomuraea soli]MBA2889927.1 hypothetical protein [Nonomuraea soli]
MEPLQMPPLVLFQGNTPAFLLAWRREESWEGRLAIPQSSRDVRGELVHGHNYRWAPAADFASLPGADYTGVPRDGAEPLRLPPLVLYSGHPAFLLAWRPFETDGRQGWQASLAVPPIAGEPPELTYLQVGASSVTRLPEVDYSQVKRGTAVS